MRCVITSLEVFADSALFLIDCVGCIHQIDSVELAILLAK